MGEPGAGTGEGRMNNGWPSVQLRLEERDIVGHALSDNTLSTDLTNPCF